MCIRDRFSTVSFFHMTNPVQINFMAMERALVGRAGEGQERTDRQQAMSGGGVGTKGLF